MKVRHVPKISYGTPWAKSKNATVAVAMGAGNGPESTTPESYIRAIANAMDGNLPKAMPQLRGPIIEEMPSLPDPIPLPNSPFTPPSIDDVAKQMIAQYCRQNGGIVPPSKE